jgi:hypothetical protein
MKNYNPSDLGKVLSEAFEKYRLENADCFNPHTIDRTYLHNRLWLAFMQGANVSEDFFKGLPSSTVTLKKNKI